MKDLLFGLALLSGPAIVFTLFGNAGLDSFDGAGESISTESAWVEAGRIAFAEKCVDCHGRMAEGSARGPSLFRSDIALAGLDVAAFRSVVHGQISASTSRNAELQAFPPISKTELDQVLAFVRALQRADDRR